MIIIIIYTVLIVLGLKIITADGMLFANKRQILEQKNIIYLDPLILCEWCMPTVYTSVSYGFYFINHPFDYTIVFYYPLCIAGASFASGVLWGFHKIILNLNDYLQLKNEVFLSQLKNENHAQKSNESGKEYY